MKRVKAACLLQTICFRSKEERPSAYEKQQIYKEYEDYKALMDARGTKFEILEEGIQPDGSVLVKLKKQYNQQPVGEYFD